VLTIELETEATTVAYDEIERFVPSGTLTTVLDAIAKGIADAVATLHDRTITTFQFVGRDTLGAIELLGEAVGNIIQIGVGVVSWMVEGGKWSEITLYGRICRRSILAPHSTLLNPQ
jgi:hypothetical protein